MVIGNMISKSAFISPCMNQSIIAEEAQFVRVRVFFVKSNVKIKNTQKMSLTKLLHSLPFLSFVCLLALSAQILHNRSLFFLCVSYV